MTLHLPRAGHEVGAEGVGGGHGERFEEEELAEGAARQQWQAQHLPAEAVHVVPHAKGRDALNERPREPGQRGKLPAMRGRNMA